MHSRQKDGTLHKYFPGISPAQGEALLLESIHNLFYAPFSISHLASNILQHKHETKGDTFLSFKGFINVNRIGWKAARPGILAPGPRNVTTAVASEGEENDQEEASLGKSLVSEDREDQGRKSSWDDMPKFLLAGAVSTIVSRTCIAPLERLKLECIVQGSKCSWTKVVQSIWVSEGLRGFWKGNVLNLFRMVPFKCINFICYDMYLDSVLKFQGKKEITNRDRLIGGGISGVLATVLCIPLDTIRTRLIAPGGDALGGIAGCVCHMVQNEGYLSLYKGLNAALISMGPASAVFYTVYDILKTSHLSSKKTKMGHRYEGELGPVRTLLYGAISGACAETVTYPLEVIRRELQLQHFTNLGLLTTLVKLVEKDGVSSLFVGLIPSTLQVLPSASLSYFFYETMKSIMKIN